ncbi:hypothetical protein IJL65_04220 [bacterium]|nr:hypothetical protein [bacterium]
MLQREYLTILSIQYLNLLDDEDEVADDEDEVDDELQLILVVNYQLMLQQIMIKLLKLILFIHIARILLKYVHSSVIQVTFGIE